MAPYLWCGVKSKSNKSWVERKEVLRKEEKIIKKERESEWERRHASTSLINFQLWEQEQQMQWWCIVEGIRVRDTPKSPPLRVCVCLCVCECDSREQLSAGRCTQQGAIRHGGVTHIKDAHTQPWNFPFCSQCAMITIKPGFFSIGFSMAIVTWFSGSHSIGFGGQLLVQ